MLAAAVSLLSQLLNVRCIQFDGAGHAKYYTYATRFAALGSRVPEKRLELFDQWSGLLTYTQQLAATQEAVIKLKAGLTLDAAQAASAAYSEMLTTLQEFLHTQGSLGLVTQHENMNYAVNFGPPLQQLAQKLDQPVPADALPSTVSAGKPRLFCLTVRTLLGEGETQLDLCCRRSCRLRQQMCQL